MVTDAILNPILLAVEWFVNLIPVWSPSFGSAGAIAVWIARVDSLIPIAGPLNAMLGVLSFGLVFVLVRIGITVWNLIWP